MFDSPSISFLTLPTSPLGISWPTRPRPFSWWYSCRSCQHFLVVSSDTPSDGQQTSAKIWKTTWPAANHEPTNNTKERKEGYQRFRVIIRCTRDQSESLIFVTDNFINSLNWQWSLFMEFSKATWWTLKESNREWNRKISNTKRWRHGGFQKVQSPLLA